MSKAISIRFLSNREIDKQRWDACIETSPNGLIYAQSFYLDNMAPGWSALANENYSWVMPITTRKKWGIGYLYQPAFTQQLGVFSNEKVEVPLQGIIDILKSKYSFWEVNWNYATAGEMFPTVFKVSKATNYILDLRSGYKEIYSSYSKDLLKNLKRSQQFGLQIKVSTNFINSIGLYKRHYGKRMPHVSDSDYNAFTTICKDAIEREMLLCREVMNEVGEVVASALLLKDNDRIYNLMNTNTDTGRKVEANHFLFDAIIKEFSGQSLLLDFEGSDLPGVKAFYENFGGLNQPFYHIKYNNLPWPLKLLKK